jgi:hypothetical protein
MERLIPWVTAALAVLQGSHGNVGKPATLGDHRHLGPNRNRIEGVLINAVAVRQ